MRYSIVWYSRRQYFALFCSTRQSARYSVLRVYLDELDEGNEQAPGVGAVHNESLQQDPRNLLLDHFLIIPKRTKKSQANSHRAPDSNKTSHESARQQAVNADRSQKRDIGAVAVSQATTPSPTPGSTTVSELCHRAAHQGERNSKHTKRRSTGLHKKQFSCTALQYHTCLASAKR